MFIQDLTNWNLGSSPLLWKCSLSSTIFLISTASANGHFIPYLLDLSAEKLTISSFRQITFLNFNCLLVLPLLSRLSPFSQCPVPLMLWSQGLKDQSPLLNPYVLTITEQPTLLLEIHILSSDIFLLNSRSTYSTATGHLYLDVP